MKSSPFHIPGLTLIELLVSIVIASFIGLAAITATTTAISIMRSNERVMETNDTAKSLIEYIVSRTQGAGGGQVRPWFALRATDNCNDETDCLLVFEADFDIPQCPIITNSSNQLNSNANGAGTCCITDDYTGRPIMVIDSNGNLAGTYQRHTISNSDTSTNCNLAFASSPPQLAAAEYNTPAGAPDDAPQSAALPSATAGGWMVAGTLTRYRIDPVSNDTLLIETEDGDPDFVFESRIADRPVHDLQFALGIDVDQSGVVDEDGTNSDEFIFNSSGEVLGSAGPTSDLRLLGIGVTVGARTEQLGGNVVQLFNGRQRSVPDTFLRGTTGRAYLRNLNIFF